MKKMTDKKLVIVDEEQSFIMITLEEYEHLLESHELVKRIDSKRERITHLTGTKSIPPTVELDLNQINNELDVTNDEPQADDNIRYESY
jgi:hypothetical protein